jgi:hypothetical protein
MFGFLYRATLGSAIGLVRGRLSLTNAFKNWSAAAKLPFVHIGLADDFWLEFDRYVEIEKARPSTFFVIPFEGRPGRHADGAAPDARATQYDVSHIQDKVSTLASAGCEIGLHGIDAWMDAGAGREEAARVSKSSGAPVSGVRMHWLYGREESPVPLEDAGFLYDSTVGYNETIGFRAGTAQVYKPVGATRLLELPLLIMDTALFTTGHLNLTRGDAWRRITPIADNVEHYGGALTVNWHDRSIAPERLWDDCYISLLDELETRRPWFATASQAVSWFQMRRSVVFEGAGQKAETVRARVACEGSANLPGLRLRVHSAVGAVVDGASSKVAATYIDSGFRDCINASSRFDNRLAEVNI